MIELYEMPCFPSPFPRKFIGDYVDPVQMQQQHEFSQAEMQSGLNGDVVQNRFVFEFSPKFLHELALDQAIQNMQMDSLDRDEICDALGISNVQLRTYLMRFKKKLKAAGKEAQFINAIKKLGEIKRKKGAKRC
jgi:response regulator of citrate/malate metabolism